MIRRSILVWHSVFATKFWPEDTQLFAFEATVQALPSVERVRADPMLADDLLDRGSRLGLLQHRQYLLLSVLRPCHCSLAGLMITAGPVFGEHRTLVA